jgi:hypothetical protein
MAVLLATHQIDLYPAAGADSHGWALSGAVPAWRGRGSWQPGAGAADPAAADRGGHGPYSPAAAPGGTVFLPPEARPAEGDTAVIGGQAWALSQVRLITDPRGSDDLTCWVAAATRAPEGGGDG